MAIFGNATIDNFTVIGTRTDVYLNYISCVLILIPFIISTLLNPAVFIFNYNKPRSAASLLYMILSASDFLTTILRPIFLSYELLKPGLDDFLSFNCTKTRLFRGFYYSLFTKLSSTTTACLAIMRFIAIQFPFYRPKKRILAAAIVAWTLISVLPSMIFICLVCKNQFGKYGLRVIWMRPYQLFLIVDSYLIIAKIEFSGNLISTTFALVASGLALIAMLMKRNTPNTGSRNKGCVTIVVMNAALIITFILQIKDSVIPIFNFQLGIENWKLIDTSTILAYFILKNTPLLLSTFNPLVIVLFSSEIKEFIRSKLRLARLPPNNTRTKMVVMSNLAQDLGGQCEVLP